MVGDQTTVSVSSQTTPQFTSSNPAVVTVDSSGNVAAVGPGTAEITVYCPAGNTYGEASATVSVTVSEPAHVHSWDGGTVTLAATCTAEGVMTYTCTGCGVTQNEAIPATGHAWAPDYTVDKAATCTEDGSRSIHCTLCGETKDSQVIPATGHQWDGGVETTPPTSSAPGVKTYTCTVCGGTRTEEIPATGDGSSSGEGSTGATPPPGPPLPQAEPPRGAKHLFPPGKKAGKRSFADAQDDKQVEQLRHAETAARQGGRLLPCDGQKSREKTCARRQKMLY